MQINRASTLVVLGLWVLSQAVMLVANARSASSHDAGHDRSGVHRAEIHLASHAHVGPAAALHWHGAAMQPAGSPDYTDFDGLGDLSHCEVGCQMIASDPGASLSDSRHSSDRFHATQSPPDDQPHFLTLPPPESRA